MKHANDHILWSDFSTAVQQIRLRKQTVEKNKKKLGKWIDIS